MGSSHFRPINRLTSNMVLVGLDVSWLTAESPIRRSPLSLKATQDAVTSFLWSFGMISTYPSLDMPTLKYGNEILILITKNQSNKHEWKLYINIFPFANSFTKFNKRKHCLSVCPSATFFTFTWRPSEYLTKQCMNCWANDLRKYIYSL